MAATKLLSSCFFILPITTLKMFFTSVVFILHLLFLANGTPILAKRSDRYIQASVQYIDQSDLMMELSVGTPGSEILVVLDTASSDLYVSLPNVTTGYYSVDFIGSFTPSDSSTFKYLNITYDMQYLSGDVWGYMGTDDVSLSGEILRNYQFAYVYSSGNGITALLGLGPIGSENVYINRYPNFVTSLVNQGLIDRGIFGLYAGTQSSIDGGSIVFGGVDVAKYSGNLVQLNCVPQLSTTKKIVNYWVDFEGFSINGDNGMTSLLQNGTAYTAIFDSGTSVLALPDAIYQYIVYDYFNVSDPDDTVSCDNNDTLNFQFDGFDITVPMSDNLFSVGAGECIIAMQSSGNDVNFYLGITTLQRIYTVFDPINIKLYVAPIIQTNDSSVFSVQNDTDLTTLKDSTASSFLTSEPKPTTVTAQFLTSTYASLYVSPGLSLSTSSYSGSIFHPTSTVTTSNDLPSYLTTHSESGASPPVFSTSVPSVSSFNSHGISSIVSSWTTMSTHVNNGGNPYSEPQGDANGNNNPIYYCGRPGY
ncbi:hypothetical protein DASC09_053180 [Saccharomycopsis crataegensis]|uniref:Peptidase A1 domain-containing protein n=1 Tax=Saccharomycopsis crataegensis TaxID=43959 RepID=A0AAV5QV49_9ASCO|nr:hypothetical protein DASC09_053180 [Saccharomycopsis crataegensis]